jgi:nicotinate (nicotinamide) nucleotide adenylyltransferase
MAMGLEKDIGDVLRRNEMTLSIAESCTGGLISDRITNVSGSSDYFKGGLVSYSIEAKADHLGIPQKYIERYGAVSSRIARKMAEGVRQAFHTTYGLSTTGVAGPTGGTKRTPVGTVFIGISDGHETSVKKENLRGDRREIKKKAAEKSLQFLYEQLARSNQNPGSRILNSECKTDMGNWIKKLRQSKEAIIVLFRKTPKGVSNRKGRLGIFPASFNPPTMAHLALIKEAMKQGKLDEILILLDIQAMDKEPVGAALEDRLTMLKKAFGRDPKVSIGLSNRGLFLEKIKPLRTYYPAPILFFFIVGFDTILRIIDKKYYRNRKRSLDGLFKESRFLVASRDQFEETAFEMLFRKRENKKYIERVSFFTLHPQISSLSSTLVRERIARGQSVDDWVPAAILPFIKEKGLYKTRSRNR